MPARVLPVECAAEKSSNSGSRDKCDRPQNPLFYRFRSFLNGIISSVLSRPRDLRSFAHHHSIPYFFLKKNNNSDLGKWLRRKAADVVVVYRMSQLLPADIIEIPKYGCINLHPAY
ncbi:MAG: hypothetical protein KGZ25_07665 [Planctomycetes bacterium]|nr:hypothetical protein [Planctomycetota bacterium]